MRLTVLFILLTVSVILLKPVNVSERGTIERLNDSVYVVGVTQPYTTVLGASLLIERGFNNHPENYTQEQLNDMSTAYSVYNKNLKDFYLLPIDKRSSGCSAQVAYYLAYSGYDGQPVAVTGCLWRDGDVLPIGGIQYKYDAALACECVTQFIAPIENQGELTTSTLPVKYIDYVYELDSVIHD